MPQRAAAGEHQSLDLDSSAASAALLERSHASSLQSCHPCSMTGGSQIAMTKVRLYRMDDHGKELIWDTSQLTMPCTEPWGHVPHDLLREL